MELEFIDGLDINLKFARGDQFPVRFKIRNRDGDYISSEDIEDIIATCREYPDLDSDMLFQKKLSDGFIEYDSENECYVFFIFEEDTRELNYGHYGYEIKIVTEEETRTFVGHIDVADEYTIGDIRKNFYLVDLEVTPTTEEQVFTHENTMGYDIVTVKAVDASIDENIRPEYIKKGVTILGVIGTLESTSFIVDGETLIAFGQSVLDTTFILNQGRVKEEMLIL